MTPNPAPPWPRPDRPYPARYRQDQPTVQVRRHMPALSRARPTPSFSPAAADGVRQREQARDIADAGSHAGAVRGPHPPHVIHIE
jgi:hypothetical protein